MSYRSALCWLFGVMFVSAGCGTGVTVPSDGGGGNLPPRILFADIEQTQARMLRLDATVADPDFDALVVTYEQFAGPFAIQHSRRSIGGVFNAMLEPTDTGLHAFRIVASDGVFAVAAEVSIVVDFMPEDSFDGDVSAPIRRPPPTGQFRIHLSGQVIGDGDFFQSFALDGDMQIEFADETEFSQNVSSVIIRTDDGTFSTVSPPGSLALSSVQDGEEVLAVAFTGLELVLTGPIVDWPYSPGQFRTADTRLAALDVAAALIQIRPAGDTVSGTIFLSSQPVPFDVLPAFAEYSAQFTGTRLGR